MNTKPHNSWIEPELEARIVALVLGEASDFERDELDRLIQERPELAAYKERVQYVHGLLENVGTGESVADDDDWKMSAEKRNAVLAVLDGNAEVQLAKQRVISSAGKRRSFKGSLVWNLTKIAAVICVVGVVGSMGVLHLRSMNSVRMAQLSFDLENTRDFHGVAEPPWGVPVSPADRRRPNQEGELRAKLAEDAGFDYARDSKSALGSIRDTLHLDVIAPTESANSRESSRQKNADRSDFNLSYDFYRAADRPMDLRPSVPKAGNVELSLPTIAANPAEPNAVILLDQETVLLGGLRRPALRQVQSGAEAVSDFLPVDEIDRNPRRALQKSMRWDFSADVESKEIEGFAENGRNLDGVGNTNPSESDSDGGGMGGGAFGSDAPMAPAGVRRKLQQRSSEEHEPQDITEMSTVDPFGDEGDGLSFGADPPTGARLSDRDEASKRFLKGETSKAAREANSIPSAANEAITSEGIVNKSGTLAVDGDEKKTKEESFPAPDLSLFFTSPRARTTLQDAYHGRYRSDSPTNDTENQPQSELSATSVTQGRGLEIAPSEHWGIAAFKSTATRGENQHRLTKRARTSPIPAGLDENIAEEEAFSTFSLHVSDVSFKLARASLVRGEWPDAAKVRIEEFVNAFDYGDPLPSQSEKVACYVEQSIHPFLQQRNLMRVSMRTAAAGRSSNTPLRLTLLLDNSGSMERPDRQQTVRRAFALLAQQLKPIDQVTLISFARQPRLLADKVSGTQSLQLVPLIDDLPSEGGTNIEAALRLAFEKALEQQLDGAQNRIVLLTDGAVNLGNANPESLSRMITTMRNSGIAFDAAGISAEGLNDEILEALTRKGDGRYYLLDSVESADDGFARQIAGALRPSAKNVKVQIEFNPKRVGRYKLLGFEKHRLNQEDFRNDRVDAAEMAAAEAGVAVYQFEAKPNGEGDVGSVSVRFRDLSTGQMIERRWPIPYEVNAPRPDQSTPSHRIATSAALLAAKFRGTPLGETVDLKALSDLIAGLPERDRNARRVQSLQRMIQQAREISGN